MIMNGLNWILNTLTKCVIYMDGFYVNCQHQSQFALRFWGWSWGLGLGIG